LSGFLRWSAGINEFSPEVIQLNTYFIQGSRLDVALETQIARQADFKCEHIVADDTAENYSQPMPLKTAVLPNGKQHAVYIDRRNEMLAAEVLDAVIVSGGSSTGSEALDDQPFR